MQCREVEDCLPLYLWDELVADQRSAVELHLEGCNACRIRLERERRLHQVLSARGAAEPDAFLLADCRNELGDALDLAGRPMTAWRRVAEGLRPSHWFGLHPAWGAALCLVIGIALGNLVPRWLDRARGMPERLEAPAYVVRAPGSSDSLQNASVTDADWLPSPDAASPEVGFALRAGEPPVLRGALDDEDVKRVLTQVVRDSQRFDAGLRLDSIDMLRTQRDDVEVRRVLCHAARNDQNPGVRLKALEALRGMGEDAMVRQILVQALLRDANPGVRVEAIHALRAFAEAAGPERATDDPQLVAALRDRMRRDPNTYVRLQSAAAIRQLGPRATY